MSILQETSLLLRFSQKLPSSLGDPPGHLSPVICWCMNPSMVQSRYLEVDKLPAAVWNLYMILRGEKNHPGLFLHLRAARELEKKKKLTGTGCHARPSGSYAPAPLSHFNQTPVLIARQGQEPGLTRLEDILGAGCMVFSCFTEQKPRASLASLPYIQSRRWHRSLRYWNIHHRVFRTTVNAIYSNGYLYSLPINIFSFTFQLEITLALPFTQVNLISKLYFLNLLLNFSYWSSHSTFPRSFPDSLLIHLSLACCLFSTYHLLFISKNIRYWHFILQPT